jgi:hypothetical protein
MSCGKESVGDVVASHSNRLSDGKGLGNKASDAAVAFVCSYPCHHEIDQGKKSAEDRQAMWEKAHRATMIWLIETGRIVVRPEGYIPPPEPVKPKRKMASGRKIESAGFQKSDRPTVWPKRSFPKRSKH